MDKGRVYRSISVAVAGAVAFILGLSFNPLSWFQNWIKALIEIPVEAMYGFIGWINLTIVEFLLVFPAPASVDDMLSIAVGGGNPQNAYVLAELYWTKTFPVFFMCLAAVSAIFFGTMQMFPDTPKTDPDRFMQRVLIASIAVLVVGVGYGLIIDLINTVTVYILPNGYTLALDLDQWQGIATGVLSGVTMLLFLWTVGFKQLILLVIFAIMLGMRMIIVYTFYVMFPFIIALWIVDVGPLKYGNMAAEFVIKATAILLLLGVIIAAILATGGAIAGDPPDNEDYDNLGSITNNPMSEDENATTGGVFSSSANGETDPGSGFSGTASGVWISVFSWWGAIWLSIVAVSMILGSTISTGFFGFYGKAKAILGQGGAKGGLSSSIKIQDPRKKAAEKGKDMGKTAWDKALSGTTGGRIEGGDISDKIGDMKQQATDGVKDKSPQFVNKIGSLAKRATSAYYGVFKQPTVMDSLYKSRDIARDSPIGHPEKESQPWRSPATQESEVSMEDFTDEDESEGESEDEDENEDKDESGDKNED